MFMKRLHTFFLIITFAINMLHATVQEHEITNDTDQEMTVELEFIGPREIKSITVAPGKPETVVSESCLIKVTVTDSAQETKESRIDPKCTKRKITIEQKETTWNITVVDPQEQLKKGEQV